MPHPAVVIEIASNHVAAARWGKMRGGLESFAAEPVGIGSISPSPVEANVAKPDMVRTVLRRVMSRVQHHSGPVALLVPDPVVRVFILSFENFPRRAHDALPLLRWRLKKSVPFDVEETVVSWMRQARRDGNIEVMAAVARREIIREYETIIEALGLTSGVVLSSTLASLPLLEERGATLLIRICGETLTTVIVNGPNVSVYRSTEMPAEGALLEPQAMLEEIFPAVAYYQDTWGGKIDRARLAGFGVRAELFRSALTAEMRIPAGTLADGVEAQHLASSARDLIRQDHEALVGWMMNGGS